jgi:Mg2+/Co2+ transporter CorC
MIPVERLVTVPPSITAGELEDVVAETGYSRFPVASAPRPASEPTAGALGATAAPSSPGRGRSRLNPARALPGRARPRTPGGDSNPGAVSTTPTGQELLGFVHAKDVLGLDAAARRQPLPLQRLRGLPAVAPEQPLTEVLTELQRLGSHLGQVQENGTTIGVIALEDVVEAFVGEVEDASHLNAESDPQPGHAYDPEAFAVEPRERTQD